MKNIKLVLNALFSIAIIYLATAIIFFTVELGVISKELPGILQSVEKIEKKVDIEILLQTVDKALDTIPSILKESENIRAEVKSVRIILPSMVEEVGGINKNIPLILGETKQIRQSINPVLQESQALRKELPGILDESQALRRELPGILDESLEIRKTIPPILEESKALREKIPLELEKVDVITQRLDRITGGGVVGDTFKGVLNIPQSILNSATIDSNNTQELDYTEDWEDF